MNPLVHLIDDDVPLLRALSRTVQSAGYAVAGYRSAKDFLAAYSSGQPGCVVLDVTEAFHCRNEVSARGAEGRRQAAGIR